jgi:hypothetical protein
MPLKMVECLSASRAHMGMPSHDKVPDNVLLNAAYLAIEMRRIQLVLTNQNWLTGDAFLSVDSNTNEYLVPDGTNGPVGKPLKVEYYDQNYPWVNGPEIKIIHLQDSNLVDNGNDDWYLSGSGISGAQYLEGSYLATAIAFYGTPLMCRIIPRPLQPVQYRIFHDGMVINIPLLAQKPGLADQFHRLLPLHMARSCVAMCQWPEPMQSNITASIEKDFMMFDAIFNEHRRYSLHPETGMRRGFTTRNMSRRGSRN